jgi:hypothetical protein
MLHVSSPWLGYIVIGLILGSMFFPYGLVGTAISFYASYRCVMGEMTIREEYYEKERKKREVD